MSGDEKDDELEARRRRKVEEEFDRMFVPDPNAPDVGWEFADAERKLRLRGRRQDWAVLAKMRDAVREPPACVHDAIDDIADEINKPIVVVNPAGVTEELPVAIDQAVVDEWERILDGTHCTGPACDRCLPEWQES
jgi:hypothetical protein